MDLRRKGYVFFLCVGVMSVSVFSLGTNWGLINFPEVESENAFDSEEVPDNASAMLVSFFSGQSLPVKGLQGRIESLGVRIPYWFATVLVVCGGLMLIMNAYQFGDFPAMMPLSLFGLAILVVAGAATEILLHGELYPAFALACIGPLGGLALTLYLDSAETSEVSEQSGDA